MNTCTHSKCLFSRASSFLLRSFVAPRWTLSPLDLIVATRCNRIKASDKDDSQEREEEVEEAALEALVRYCWSSTTTTSNWDNEQGDSRGRRKVSPYGDDFSGE